MDGVILVLVIVFLLAILVVLFIVEMRLRSRIKGKMPRHFSVCLIKLRKIKNSKLDGFQKLSKIDVLFKSYIKEKENIKEDMEYSELMEHFRSEKNNSLFNISKEFLGAYYLKEELSSINIDKLISLLEMELR